MGPVPCVVCSLTHILPVGLSFARICLVLTDGALPRAPFTLSRFQPRMDPPRPAAGQDGRPCPPRVILEVFWVQERQPRKGNLNPREPFAFWQRRNCILRLTKKCGRAGALQAPPTDAVAFGVSSWGRTCA